MRILLTGSRGLKPGFIGGTFALNYSDKYDITEYTGDIRQAKNIVKIDSMIKNNREGT